MKLAITTLVLIAVLAPSAYAVGQARDRRVPALRDPAAIDGHLTRRTAGGRRRPSSTSAFGSYRRRKSANGSRGAGNQLASRSGPGLSFWMNSSSAPSTS